MLTGNGKDIDMFSKKPSFRYLRAAVIGSVALLILQPVLASALANCTAADSRVFKADDEHPKLVSLTVKPKQLKKNNLNKLRLVVKYEDGEKNLQGGALELSVSESNGYRREFSISLDSSKFSKSRGKGKLKFNIVIGNCKWAKFKAWLKDAADNAGNEKQVKLSAKGSKGPKWGVKLNQRAEDFTLLDQNGNEVSLHDYWGKVILLDFAGTH